MAGLLESLDAEETLERRRHRHWYDRLMMLADGVFAVALTFLAVDVGTAPAGWTGSLGALWAHLGPQLETYAISFLVISIYWLAHRRFMSMVLTVDAPLTVLTLVMLGLVALLPPATRLIQGYEMYPAARLTYSALVVAIGVSMAAMWGYASLVARVVVSEVSVRARWFLMALMALTPPVVLSLNFALPGTPPAGVVPAVLLVLFVVGWRLRRWILRRPGGPFVG
ncbi:MAG TPA: TMEM175 family protein [Phenylobacterium sp.]|nr:TMEM175 family protein [Phenylobacterium sp.]